MTTILSVLFVLAMVIISWIQQKDTSGETTLDERLREAIERARREAEQRETRSAAPPPVAPLPESLRPKVRPPAPMTMPTSIPRTLPPARPRAQPMPQVRTQKRTHRFEHLKSAPSTALSSIPAATTQTRFSAPAPQQESHSLVAGRKALVSASQARIEEIQRGEVLREPRAQKARFALGQIRQMMISHEILSPPLSMRPAGRGSILPRR